MKLENIAIEGNETQRSRIKEALESLPDNTLTGLMKGDYLIVSVDSQGMFQISNQDPMSKMNREGRTLGINFPKEATRTEISGNVAYFEYSGKRYLVATI